MVLTLTEGSPSRSACRQSSSRVQVGRLQLTSSGVPRSRAAMRSAKADEGSVYFHREIRS
jgi:hypothetical protein